VVRALSPTDAAPNKVNGLFYRGGFDLLGIQTVATVAVLAYSFAVTWVIAKVLNITVGLRHRRGSRTPRHRHGCPLRIRLPDG
jgi:ammonia channel protein AmtB